MSTIAAMTSWVGPFGPGFCGAFDENSRRYFCLLRAQCKLKSVEGSQNDSGADQPTRAYEERTHSGDDAISETEIGRTFPGWLEDEQLLLDEDGFGHHRTGAAGTGHPGERRQQMDKKDGQIAHGQS